MRKESKHVCTKSQQNTAEDTKRGKGGQNFYKTENNEQNVKVSVLPYQ